MGHTPADQVASNQHKRHGRDEEPRFLVPSVTKVGLVRRTGRPRTAEPPDDADPVLQLRIKEWCEVRGWSFVSSLVVADLCA